MAGAIERALAKESALSSDASLHSSDESIGELFITEGVLARSDVEEILAYARAHDVRFGQAAIALQKIREDELDKVLSNRLTIPHVQLEKGDLSSELVTAYKPFSRQAEIIRYIRAQLVLGGETGDKNVLAIVSPAKRDGRTFLAANLAVAFAQLGKRTLLLDCHLQKPRQDEVFRIQGAPGIATMLAGRSDLAAGPTVIDKIPQLSVFPAGPCPPNPDEIIASDAFGRFLLEARRKYDAVIVDTPPGDSSTAVDWIAARCRTALVIYRRDKTSLAKARDFADRMRTRATVAGAILNQY
jgi:chain length determinant protein tyrosine kinase EpsG